MTPAAIVLILISAAMHAGWNLVTKREGTTLAEYSVALTCGAVFLSPLLWVFRETLPHTPPMVPATLAVSTFFTLVYIIGLVGAYRFGDMSAMYPLLRALPVLLVTAAALALGRSRSLSFLYCVGAALIVFGCFSLPLRSYRLWHWRHYVRRSCLFAILAASGTACYSLLDDHALRLYRAAPAPAVPAAALYTVFWAWMVSGWLWICVLCSASIRRVRFRIVFRGIVTGRIAFTGIVVCVSYGLMLQAMAFASDVSYLVAFRQLSVPLGAMLGMAVLGEPRPLPRVLGIALTFAGLLLVGIG